MKTLGLSIPAVALALAFTGCDSGDPEEEPHCDPDLDGTICTIAGNGENGYDRTADSEDLEALEARLSLPQDTLTGPDGTVYILDWNNHRVRKLEDGLLKWVAGRGELGGSLDDPMNGDFNHPTNIIWDQTGDNIVIAAWHNSKIRVIDPGSGEVHDTCGDGKRANFGNEGPAMTASFDLPASIAYDPAGNLVIMDQANQSLRSVDPEGNVHLLAGNCVVDAPMPAGPGPCAEGVAPVQCPEGPNGPSSKFTCGDPMTTCSKPCTPSYSGDDIPATEMRMSQPFGQSASPAGRIAFDGEGRLYFADTSNHLIRMIDTDGIVHRVAGLPPEGGMKQNGYSGDGGPATEAKLNFPVDLAFGDDGTLYFSDVQNHCIRAIAPDGTIDSVVGQCGEKGFEGDGLPPDEALLNIPFGVEYADGRLIVADTGNMRIRSVLLP
jgi:DNA-binding beta-propeller fold protein YncE